MSEIVLFHHALGLTDGIRRFATALRDEGHVVHTPDLFEGRTFADLDGGVAHAEVVGFETLVEMGVAAASDLPRDVVYAGFSLGVMPAQKSAQTRAGARGALLYHSAVPPTYFGDWPDGLPVQIHIMADDPWAEEDLEAAGEIESSVEGAELFVYPGSAHLFAEEGWREYDAAAAAALIRRSLEFLASLD